MKRLLWCVLALSLLVAGPLLAGPKKEAASAKATLVFESRLWSPPHEQEFIISEILEPYAAEKGIRINFSVLSDDDLLDRAAVQKQTKNISTDLVIAYVARFSEWVDKGYVVDLTSWVAAQKDRTFAPGIKSMCVFGGKQYFVPIASDVYLLCANKKALKYLPAGADVQNLSWEQFVDWAVAMAKGEGEGKVAVTGVPEKALIYQVSGVALSYGAGFPDVSSDGARTAWELMLRMKDAFTPTVQTYDSLVEPMKRGEAWLTWAHIANVGEVYSSNPAQYVIAPVPRGPAGKGSIAGTQGFGVIAGGQQQLALDLVEYMTRPDVQLKMSRGSGGWIPPVAEAVKLLGDSTQDEVIKKAIDVMQNGKLAFIPPIFGGNWGKVKRVYDDIAREILASGKVDPAMLKSMQAKIDSYKM